MRCGHLFNGIGGFQLAAHWMGWENVFHCEIDPFCNAVVSRHFPESISYGDICSTNFVDYRGAIELLSGGFPCTDISKAGKGVGIRGAASGLWSQFKRAIFEVHPEFIIIENSDQLARRGLEVVLFDLAEMGYDAEWAVIRASDVGACHRRARLWIVAYPNFRGWQGILCQLNESIVESKKQYKALDTSRHPFLQFEQRYGEPAVFGIYDGLPKRMDVVKRLGAYGNAVVPHIPFEIFKRLKVV